jgi:hypothetical protein
MLKFICIKNIAVVFLNQNLLNDKKFLISVLNLDKKNKFIADEISHKINSSLKNDPNLQQYFNTNSEQ